MSVVKNTHGFSLVELSIVLVILGLLTGGILTGQNLIRAAELRSMATELSSLQTAVHTFRDKYFALPGDMNNATDFWGAMTNCGVASPSGTGTQTCNGDGDGLIDQPSAVSRTGENFSFWQHLANAGLIEGAYTGIAGSESVTHSIIGTNVPTSKLSSAGWSARYIGSTGTSTHFVTTYGNTISFGTIAQSSGGVDFDTYGAALLPEEAWNIDIKLDDGHPAQGKILAAANLTQPYCTKVNSGALVNTNFDRTYSLDYTTKICGLFIRQQF